MSFNPAFDGLLDLLAEATVRALESAAEVSPRKIAARGRENRPQQRTKSHDDLQAAASVELNDGLALRW